MQFKILIISIILFFSCYFINAQTGFVVTNSGDTITGNVTFWNELGGYEDVVKVYNYGEGGKMRAKNYFPKKIKSFKIHNETIYSMSVISNLYSLSGITVKKQFVKKEYEGEISLYSRVFSINSNYTPGASRHGANFVETVYYFKRKHDDRLHPAELSKRELIKYFIDCKILAEKIKKKEVHKRDYLTMVQMYNSCHSAEAKLERKKQ